MGSLRKSLKRKAFRKAKEVLPDSTVLEIQRRRLEGRRAKPGSYAPSTTYAVVSAVYNVEAYLDDYFESLMSQTVDPAALRVIAVDDGSTDASAEVIRSWQERFPGRIDYVRKENGGQASARNLGMSIVEAEWVTFIDPDDFVSHDYFEQVDRAITAHPQLQFVSCNWIYYYEKQQRVADKHPLRYRFKQMESYYDANDDWKPIQFAMNSVFFRSSKIRKQGILINEAIRPNFEDGHFVNKYLLNLTEGIVGFLKAPKYYYRKRSAGTSTLDSSWETSDRVLIVPERGYLDLLQYASKTKGYVPLFLQNAILYDLTWYFKRFVGHPERSRKIEISGKSAQFLNTLRSIFEYIDTSTIMNCSGDWCNFNVKTALLSNFKSKKPEYFIAYLERVDFKKKRFLIQSICPDLALSLDGCTIHPIETKERSFLFFGESFFSTYYMWFPFESSDQILSYSCNDHSLLSLSIRGKQFPHTISVGSLIHRYTKDWEAYEQHNNIWIIMDRDTQADDNGEHFYRYMAANHPEQKCFFALRKTSKDWERLKKEGFGLLDFGSKTFEEELRHCSKIISSHVEPYIYSYFKDSFHRSKDYVFLQHGITKDDLSPWLNNKPISLMVTATNKERKSITDNGTSYSLTPSQVALTGFPRHDHLVKNATNKGATILVMPTWRGSLVGSTNGKGNIREINPTFSESEYKKAWESLLNSIKLRRIAENSKCRIVFYPHANIAPYLEKGFFSVPHYVELASNTMGASIQNCFIEASVLITDYSSTAFEVAYLKKPCLYYQFDKEEFFSGTQVYAKGYFDYERDGFGPVAYTEDELLDALEGLAACGFEPQEPYRSRMEETFPFRDGKCCERVYEAIKSLDEPA